MGRPRGWWSVAGRALDDKDQLLSSGVGPGGTVLLGLSGQPRTATAEDTALAHGATRAREQPQGSRTMTMAGKDISGEPSYAADGRPSCPAAASPEAHVLPEGAPLSAAIELFQGHGDSLGDGATFFCGTRAPVDTDELRRRRLARFSAPAGIGDGSTFLHG